MIFIMEDILKNPELDKRIRIMLEEAGIYTFTDVLAASERDLLSRVNLCVDQIASLRSLALSSLRFPQRLPSIMLLESPGRSKYWHLRRSVGCPVLDRFLKGGIPARGIFELSGESGSGKTQLCLQAAIAAQLQPCQNTSHPPGTVYICTEDPFPSNRLLQIIEELTVSCPSSKGFVLGDRIFVEHVCDLAGLKDCLLVRVPHLLRTSAIPFGLVVVDSIAGVFRGSGVDGSDVAGDERFRGIAGDLRSRAMDLKDIAAALHSLARTFGLSVICVNQVSDSVDGIQCFGCNKKVPALGLAWANMLTTRLMTSRTKEHFNIAKDGRGTLVRELEVIFSPELRPGKCKYIVTQSGVHGIE